MTPHFLENLVYISVAFQLTGQILLIFSFGLLIGCKKDILDPNLVENKNGWFKNSLLHEKIGLEMGRKLVSFQVYISDSSQNFRPDICT